MYLGHDVDKEFESIIYAKSSAPELLRQELSRSTWKREVVAVGTAVDPYQPAEGRYKLTRRILEVLLECRTPCSLVTKNSMVLRDIDLLKALAKEVGCQVHLSITTTDRRLARLVEPDTPPPESRLETLQALVKAGVPAGVLLAPVLPGLTDAPYQIERIVKAAARHGARFLFANVLRLAPGSREVYFSFLERHYPVLIPLYHRLYRGSYPPPWYRDKVMQLVSQMVAKWGIPQEDLLARPSPWALTTGADSALPTTRAKRSGGGVQLELAWG